MKPMNFPERRNQRRKEALVRLEDAFKKAKAEFDGKKCIQLEKAIENTKAKISAGSRFMEQSKIRRSGQRK